MSGVVLVFLRGAARRPLLEENFRQEAILIHAPNSPEFYCVREGTRRYRETLCDCGLRFLKQVRLSSPPLYEPWQLNQLSVLVCFGPFLYICRHCVILALVQNLKQR